jgi:hypothetical protein
MVIFRRICRHMITAKEMDQQISFAGFGGL